MAELQTGGTDWFSPQMVTTAQVWVGPMAGAIYIQGFY